MKRQNIALASNGELHKYLVKVRRHKVGDELDLRAKNAWCVIDIKSIKKVLPMLNELGVSRITFVYCDRSQINIKLDFARFERILEASMQQCGRG